MTDAIHRLAERLADSGKTFVSDPTLLGYGRRFGLDFDSAREAAIRADRLRRQRQIEEGRPGFIARPLPLDAPIVLKVLTKRDRAERRG